MLYCGNLIFGQGISVIIELGRWSRKDEI